MEKPQIGLAGQVRQDLDEWFEELQSVGIVAEPLLALARELQLRLSKIPEDRARALELIMRAVMSALLREPANAEYIFKNLENGTRILGVDLEREAREAHEARLREMKT